MEMVYSIHGVPIRLPDERWEHITENKPYMEAYFDRVLEAIEEPEWLLRGYAGSPIAVIPVGKQRFLHVIYKEVSQDNGFVITAYIVPEYNKRQVIWSQNS